MTNLAELDHMHVPQGSFRLRRFPERSRELLRAWDAADEYLLSHVHELLAASESGSQNILIANDEFGAIGVTLASRSNSVLTSWNDSAVSQRALMANLARNSGAGATAEITTLASTQDPPGPIDLVVMKVPKSNGQLEDQLHRLRPSLQPETHVVAAGMVKNIHSSTLELFEQVIGPTHTSLAKKRARLIFAKPNLSMTAPTNPWPLVWSHNGLDITNHGGVFAARKLDAGTRFFMRYLPEMEGPGTILDYGCGNGILGTVIASRAPEATVVFVDESHAAMASTEATFRAKFPARSAEFTVSAELADDVAEASIDVIINNPPFHQNNAITDAQAWEMFQHAHRALVPGGELWVVGNRHLQYHLKLHRIFGNCETIAGNPKFVVLRAQR